MIISNIGVPNPNLYRERNVTFLTWTAHLKSRTPLLSSHLFNESTKMRKMWAHAGLEFSEHPLNISWNRYLPSKTDPMNFFSLLFQNLPEHFPFLIPLLPHLFLFSHFFFFFLGPLLLGFLPSEDTTVSSVSSFL